MADWYKDTTSSCICSLCSYFQRLRLTTLNLQRMSCTGLSWSKPKCSSVRLKRHTGSKISADFRSQKSEPTFGMRVMWQQIRFPTPISAITTCSIPRSILEKHVIDRNSCIDWSLLFLFCLFVNSTVNTFQLPFFLFWFATIEMKNAAAWLSTFSAMSVFGSENWRRFSTRVSMVKGKIAAFHSCIVHSILTRQDLHSIAIKMFIHRLIKEKCITALNLSSSCQGHKQQFGMPWHWHTVSQDL